jgi:hypothetical protein
MTILCIPHAQDLVRGGPSCDLCAAKAALEVAEHHREKNRNMAVAYHEQLAAADALREAAGKVRCAECGGSGIARDDETRCGYDCPDCSDLRRLLGESHE